MTGFASLNIRRSYIQFYVALGHRQGHALIWYAYCVSVCTQLFHLYWKQIANAMREIVSMQKNHYIQRLNSKMATKFPIGHIHGYSMVSKHCYCLLILLITANLISQMQASPGNRKESWALIKEHVSNHCHVTLVTCQDEIVWVADLLTHWGRATQKCLSKFTIIGSDNGLSPIRRQAIIWTNAGILLTNFSEILIQIHTFSIKKMRLKSILL